MKDADLRIRLEKEELEKLKASAKNQGTSMSALIRWAINNDCSISKK